MRLLAFLLTFLCSSPAWASLVLSNTTDKIQMVWTAGASTSCKASASWRDITTTAFTPGRTVTSSNGSTAIDVVDAPGASTHRVIDTISIYSGVATTQTLTIRYYASGAEYILWTGQVYAGGRVEYSDQEGFVAYMANGSERVSSEIGASKQGVWNMKVLKYDQTFTTNTANQRFVTDLWFPVKSGKNYIYKIMGTVYTGSTTNGANVTVLGAGQTFNAFYYHAGLTSTNRTYGTYSAWEDPNTGVVTMPTEYYAISKYTGNLQASADGKVQAGIVIEIASTTATLKAGATIEWMEVA